MKKAVLTKPTHNRQISSQNGHTAFGLMDFNEKQHFLKFEIKQYKK